MLFLKALVDSFKPRKYREVFVTAPVAFISGSLELLVFGYLEFLQFRQHLLALTDYFSQGNETTQGTAVLLIMVSELFYPLSLIFIFLAAEGFARATSAAIVGDRMPSLLVSVPLKLWERFHRAPRKAIVR